MPLEDDLKAHAADTFRTTWTTRRGQVVPTDTSVTLGNDGVELDATILYADMADSTKMVNALPAQQAAEIYKVYLNCAGKIIRAEGGTITAYDGDRIMAVFLGGTKNTDAARTGLKINYAVRNIVQPAYDHMYGAQPNLTWRLKSHVGIDTSSILVAKTGVRGANDLVWVGRAANYAAKLAALENYSTYVTAAVYDVMLERAKMGGSPRRNMWAERRWTDMNDMRIYGSNWTWRL